MLVKCKTVFHKGTLTTYYDYSSFLAKTKYRLKTRTLYVWIRHPNYRLARCYRYSKVPITTFLVLQSGAEFTSRVRGKFLTRRMRGLDEESPLARKV